MILAKVDKLYSQKHWCLSWKTGRNTWPKGLEPISLSQMTASNKEPVAVHNVSKPFSTKMILLLVSDSNPAPTCCFTMHVGHVPSLRWSPPPPTLVDLPLAGSSARAVHSGPWEQSPGRSRWGRHSLGRKRLAQGVSWNSWVPFLERPH